MNLTSKDDEFEKGGKSGPDPLQIRARSAFLKPMAQVESSENGEINEKTKR